MSPFGGDEGIRTPDPLLAGQVLSQLSYTPVVPPGTESRTTTYPYSVPLRISISSVVISSS